MKRTLLLVLWLWSSLLLAQDVRHPIHHELKVALQPQQQELTVSDQITLPESVDSLSLRLHAGLKPRFFSERGEIIADKLHADNDLERYQFFNEQDDFDSVHPSLTRISQLNMNYGL